MGWWACGCGVDGEVVDCAGGDGHGVVIGVGDVVDGVVEDGVVGVVGGVVVVLVGLLVLLLSEA